MLYYHINKQTLEIISGPHDLYSREIKKITRCGTPEYLNLTQYDLVPEIRDSLLENQYYDTPIVTIDSVLIKAVDKDQDTINNEKAKKLQLKKSNLSCTQRQMRLLLMQQNLLSTVQNYIDNSNELTKIEWEYASEIKRTHPTILEISNVLGLTDIQLDELFELAMTL